GARDLDAGSNSIQSYSIAPDNDYFSVAFGSQIKGKKYVELVLEMPLDREEQAEVDFSLVAMDGGSPPRTFEIDPTSGEIKLTKPLDFEAAENHELSVQATDGGGLSAICRVLVEVVDVNDNAPELVVSSFSSPLPENALPGTVVALFTVRDRDAGANGRISCALEDQLSVSLQPAYKNYFELVTVSALDREEMARYILTVTAADAGSPPLTTTHTFTVDISDVNDNAPVFNQTSYTMYVRENSVPTVLVGTISAVDADVGSNAKVTYSLVPVHPAGEPSCSCISVNSETGDVFVLRPLAAFIARKVCKGKEIKDGHVVYGANNLQSSLADAAAAGTLPHAYCSEIRLTTGSGNRELKLLKPILPSLPPELNAA
ncbi:PREDICTED: protocadherin beta-15-like, partial [Nestor notabilis]|uniref:protocadherin beta-15-like n=1 Tax=Nestor notabilis TaxID=176057 RepID=UPI00052358A3